MLARVVDIDFGSIFDAVNYMALILKLQLLGIGGNRRSIFKEFSTNRTQCVVADGACSVSWLVISGVLLLRQRP